jgi:hypothetical protein
MAAFVDRAGQLDPAACRASAQRFSPPSVAASYEAVYQAVATTAASARA